MSSQATGTQATHLRSRDDLNFTPGEWERLRNVEEKQNALQDWLKRTHPNKIADEKLLQATSYLQFAQYWTQASEQQQRQYQVKRENGSRKWTRKMQTFALNAGDFMKDFSAMLDFAKVAGQPYSGPAIATVSFLFTIVQTRFDLDTQISTAILTAKDRLPGFQMYEGLYSGRDEHQLQLKKKIILAYSAFVAFTIEATRYYLKGGLRRWYIAIFDPGAFEKLINDVQSSVREVRASCEDLLTKTVHEISTQNKELLEKVGKLQEDNLNTKLTKIQHMLGLSDWSLEQRQKLRAAYEHRLRLACQDEPSFVQQMTNAFITRYKDTTCYKEWRTAKSSSMLLLIGVNNEFTEQGKVVCWASPLALNIMSELELQTKNCVWLAVNINSPTSMRSLMAEIILQLLRCRRAAVDSGEDFASLVAILTNTVSPYEAEESQESKEDALSRAAMKVLEVFAPDEMVYIVIDRIDCCMYNDRTRFMEMILKIMSNFRGTLKVFALANRTTWNVSTKYLEHKELLIQHSLVQGILYGEY